nr:MAG TPA: C-5 cytosine-specific DNA methylase [Caudoviricetes sp.]
MTERECWRLQGFDDEDFNAALAVHPPNGRMNRTLYKQAGNSMPVNVLEALFEVII